MRRQTYKFDQALIKALVDKEIEREPSGRMSATRLTWPTQWQILWKLGVPLSPQPHQESANKENSMHLRHFARGKQCEDWLEQVLVPKGSQIEVNYRGWTGYADRIDDGELLGVDDDIVCEVKSVMADKWYRMFLNKGEGDGPQFDHVLQANFYAVGLNLPRYALIYLKADTLETRTFIYDTDDYRADVDNHINQYDEAVKLETIPIFKAKVEYQKNKKYNMYWEYRDMGKEELLEVYKKYKK